MIVTFNEIPATVEELIAIKNDLCLTVHQTLSRILEIEKEAREKVDIPSYKQKPLLKTATLDPEALRKLADEIEEWEKYNADRKSKLKKQSQGVPNTGDLLEEFIRHESGLVDKVPKQYQDKVYRHAWESGHSSGYSEVYIHLVELVDIFE